MNKGPSRGRRSQEPQQQQARNAGYGAIMEYAETPVVLKTAVDEEDCRTDITMTSCTCTDNTSATNDHAITWALPNVAELVDDDFDHDHVHHDHGYHDYYDHASKPSLARLISEVRSDDESEIEEETNESEFYRKSTPFERAVPERMFALIITLILEIPVLLMVSGGSDELCQLIGRRKYQLLIGFLPLTSAISGNVGLQSSTLTTRAISHAHVTVKDYWIWLSDEVSAALYLGVGMGFTLGLISFGASRDWAFSVTIFVAQILSIVTAGLTGTLAPLMFSFIFHRDSGKWGGPLETAVQDIVGSFAMVIVSYHLLKLLGAAPVDPKDMCGAG
jgi:cation transporter-like permease